MRYLQILVSVVTIFHVHQVLAIQTTETELDEFRLLFEQQSLVSVLHAPKDELDKQLEGLSPGQSIWLKQQWLLKLSVLTQPSVDQQLWLENQLSNKESLTTANPDHPEKQLVIIDIARQAETTLMHWKINQYVDQLQIAWNSKQWDWQKVLSTQNRVAQYALKQWLQNIDEHQAQQVAEHYFGLAKYIPLTSNEVLAQLAIKAKSVDLLAFLWMQPTDEYSYVALSKLPSLFDDYQAVEQLALALNNNGIQSQALFAIASRYSSNERAQQLFSKALDEPDLKWHAAAVLSKIKDQAFTSSLANKLRQQAPSSFSKLAQKNLLQAKNVRAKQ
jgi:hypothetical protein